MTVRSMKNAPPLAGWTIASGAGAVAFGASLVAVGLDGIQSVAVGAVVLLIVGIVFTAAETPLSPPGALARDAQTAVQKPRAPEAAAPAAAPAADPAPMAAADAVGSRPQGLAAPRGGQGDELQKITGVGPVLEQRLNGIGIYHFSQIAAWSEAEIAWVDSYLDFKGRIQRDGWIDQARALASDEAGSGT